MHFNKPKKQCLTSIYNRSSRTHEITTFKHKKFTFWARRTLVSKSANTQHGLINWVTSSIIFADGGVVTLFSKSWNRTLWNFFFTILNFIKWYVLIYIKINVQNLILFSLISTIIDVTSNSCFPRWTDTSKERVWTNRNTSWTSKARITGHTRSDLYWYREK